MMKSPFLASALLIATLALPLAAQDAMKKDTPVKPADPPSKVLLDSWNDIGRKLVAMAEDFPEDKYEFKPTPAQRAFERADPPRCRIQLLLHQSRAGQESTL